MTDFFQEQCQAIETHLVASVRPQLGLPASLLEAMRYSLLAPGKRIRPLLVVLASEASGGKNPWPAACAVEMIHAYSLIHDDLPAMDNDDLRRGLPTCHKKFGEALAILAGDALLTRAFEVLAEGYRAEIAAACCKELARAAGAAGMVGGQVDDLAWENAHEQLRSVEELEALHTRKTGALIQACLRLGVLSADEDGRPASSDLLHRLTEYGRCLGLAFQITDDLLDVEGQSENTGKRVQKDAARGKLTYPGILGVAESRDRAARMGEMAREQVQALGAAGRRLHDLVSVMLERDR